MIKRKKLFFKNINYIHIYIFNYSKEKKNVCDNLSINCSSKLLFTHCHNAHTHAQNNSVRYLNLTKTFDKSDRYECYEIKGSDSEFLMIGTCTPKSFHSYGQSGNKDKCEAFGDQNNVTDIPVVSLKTRHVYKNKYCAWCNGEPFIKSWTPLFTCYCHDGQEAKQKNPEKMLTLGDSYYQNSWGMWYFVDHYDRINQPSNFTVLRCSIVNFRMENENSAPPLRTCNSGIRVNLKDICPLSSCANNTYTVSVDNDQTTHDTEAKCEHWSLVTDNFKIRPIPTNLHAKNVFVLWTFISSAFFVAHLTRYFTAKEKSINMIRKNLFSYVASALLGDVFDLIAILTLPDGGGLVCRFVAIFTIYFYLVSTMWKFIILVDVWWVMHKTNKYLRMVEDSRNETFFKYSVFAWLTPAVIIALPITLQWFNLDMFPELRPDLEYGCWFGNELSQTVFFNAPIFILIVVKSLMLFRIIWLIYIMRHGVSNSTNTTFIYNFKMYLKIYLKLSLFMGLPGILFFITLFYKDSILKETRTIIYSLQGMLVFLTFDFNWKIVIHFFFGKPTKAHEIELQISSNVKSSDCE